MKTLLFQSLVLALFLPSLALAAFNDATLTTSTILSVNSYTLDVTGTSAVIQSIVVNPTNVVVTMLPGSSLQVTSPTYQQMTTDNPALVTTNSCAANTSVLTLSGGSGTVTVTPASTVCSTTPSSPAPSTPSSGGGTIVGLITSDTAPTIAVAATTTTASSTPISALQSEVAALTAELNSLLSQVHATTTTTFTRNLSLGMTGSDVTALQSFLITQASGVKAVQLKAHGTTNYFGTLTQAALQEFQKKVTINPASGYFGPITRAYVNGGK